MMPKDSRFIVGVSLMSTLIIARCGYSAPATIRVNIRPEGYQAGTAPDLEQGAISADGRFLAFVAETLPPDGGSPSTARQAYVQETATGAWELVSAARDGTPGNGSSWTPSLSADGRYVAFVSDASNLVADDTNKTADVFVRDRVSHTTTRVSVASDGTQANEISYEPDISADGRYIAFTSRASDLVPETSSRVGYDIFHHDRRLGITRLVNRRNTNGLYEPNRNPSISADGRFVAYQTRRHLDDDVSHPKQDVYLRDMVEGTWSQVSVGSNGQMLPDEAIQPSISDDGRYVVFLGSSIDYEEPSRAFTARLVVRDVRHGTTTVLKRTLSFPEGDRPGYGPSISADGRLVAFSAIESDLVPGDTNRAWDVFLWEPATGTITRASIGKQGEQPNAHSGGPLLNADGRYVLFSSPADNLEPHGGLPNWDLFLKDMASGGVRRVSSGLPRVPVPPFVEAWTPQISENGRYVAFVGRHDEISSNHPEGHVYIRELGSGTTRRVAQFSTSPSLSSNGRYIAFHYQGTYPEPGDPTLGPGIYVLDTSTGETSLVTPEDMDRRPQAPRISGDGRYVLVAMWGLEPETSLYVHDRQTGTATPVDIAPDGGPPNQRIGQFSYAISGDGRFVTFVSYADNLVSGDTNGYSDVFVRDMVLGRTERVSVSSSGRQGDRWCEEAVISKDGRFVAFTSWANNLVPRYIGGIRGVFVRDRVKGTTTLASVSTDGVQAHEGSHSLAISPVGRFVAFCTPSRNLVTGDSGVASKVFLRDTVAGTTRLVSNGLDGPASGGNQNGLSHQPSLRGDGRFAVFESYATNLVPDDTNQGRDIFLHGPMAEIPGGMKDVAFALRLAAGLWWTHEANLTRLDVVNTGASAGRIDLEDVAQLLRQVWGR